jgi:hypothetical protein
MHTFNNYISKGGLLMEQILETIGGWISMLSEKIDFGQDASVATTLLFIFAGIGLATVVFKLIRKILGKAIAIVLVIAILISSGFLSMSQVKNFAQSAGLIYQQGLPEAVEKDGTWLIEFFENLIPGKEDGAGTWVPEKETVNHDDWLPEE